MANKFLDLAGLTYYDGKLKAVAAGAIAISGLVISLNAVDGTALGSVTIPAASDSVAGAMSAADYTKLSGIAAGAQVNVIEEVQVNGVALVPSSKSVNVDLSAYALKTDITNVYKYKGSVATYDDLPTTGLTAGDVYNVVAADESHGIDAGENVAWTGSAWDALGGSFQMDVISNAEIDALFNDESAA